MSLLTDMELIGNKVNFLDIELIRKELNVSNHQNLSFSFEIFYDWLRLLALFIFNEENANIDNHSKSLYSLLSSVNFKIISIHYFKSYFNLYSILSH
jgi:hypothetical protein